MLVEIEDYGLKMLDLKTIKPEDKELKAINVDKITYIRKFERTLNIEEEKLWNKCWLNYYELNLEDKSVFYILDDDYDRLIERF